MAFYQLKGEIDMKAFDVGGWCNYCSILITDIPFETIKSEVRHGHATLDPLSPPVLVVLEPRWHSFKLNPHHLIFPLAPHPFLFARRRWLH